MRRLFSLENRFKTWRTMWVSLAGAEYQAGLLSKKELSDLKKQQDNIDINEIFENEKVTRHDVVAAIKEYASKAKVGGGKIHLGATSMDIVDNSDTLIVKDALLYMRKKTTRLLGEFIKLIEKYHALSCIGFTHLQPAEPTTVGYRMSFYVQDLYLDLEFLDFIVSIYKGKGIKGAVGTGASYVRLLKGNKLDAVVLEKKVMDKIGIDPFAISSQVSTRKLDYFVLSFLASLTSSISKFAEDLRILQSPTIGEWSEPFGKNQVGSSAMPFKKNPINSEKICSLSRYVAQLPNIVLGNATLSHLERTLDDSANRRIVIPESFLATDEILDTALKIVPNIVINTKNIENNLLRYAPFAATEIVIGEAVKKGADRQKVHEEIRVLSMNAWEAINKGEENPLKDYILKSHYIAKYLKAEEINKYINVRTHIGDASKRSLLMVKQIKKVLKKRK